MKRPSTWFALALVAFIAAVPVGPAGCTLKSADHATVESSHRDAIDRPITKEEVLAAQAQWGEGIVAIGKERENFENAKKRAILHINSLYAYDQGGVLFKPTLAAEDQFRGSFEEALSYFVGGNSKSPEDHGFAMTGYTNVRFENENIILLGSSALAMGNYFFTKPGGEIVKVEYSFAYRRDHEGHLRICLHHSSLPYAPHK